MIMKMCWVKSEEFIANQKYIVCFASLLLGLSFYLALSRYYDTRNKKIRKNEDDAV